MQFGHKPSSLSLSGYIKVSRSLCRSSDAPISISFFDKAFTTEPPSRPIPILAYIQSQIGGGFCDMVMLGLRATGDEVVGMFVDKVKNRKLPSKGLRDMLTAPPSSFLNQAHKILGLRLQYL